MDDACLGVRILTTESEAEAKQLAEQLDQLNRARQQLEADIMREAVIQIGDVERLGALVVASRRWHLGVVGIVAARLVERYDRPAVVLAINEQGIGKGSARTVPGFDLYQALACCRDLLMAFGGHPSAAGLTIREDRLPEFSERFNALAGTWAAESQAAPTLHLDSEVALDDVNHRLLQEIDALHPFGAGNPEPMFAGKRLEIMNARVVGEKHLKLTLKQGRSIPFDGIGFGMKSLEEQGVSLRTLVDVAFTPELNHWNGYDRIQLRIRGLRPAAGE
jgi:single-stranded-DNA-specific exonuclease